MPEGQPDALVLTAHVVSRLVAARPTSSSEMPALVDAVAATVSALINPPIQEEARRPIMPEPAERPGNKRWDKSRAVAPTVPLRSSRPISQASRPVAVPSETVEPAPPPRLVRRAEAVTGGPAPDETPLNLRVPAGRVRGVVRWFDPARQSGALRLPGASEDVPIDTAVFQQSGIARLFKGQEIDAEIDRSKRPVRITAIVLPGTQTSSTSSSGMVAGGRRARLVVVEKKGDSLKRAAARNKAEKALGTSNDKKPR